MIQDKLRGKNPQPEAQNRHKGTESQRVLTVNEAVSENDQVARLPCGKYTPAHGIGISVHDAAENGEKHGQVKPLRRIGL